MPALSPPWIATLACALATISLVVAERTGSTRRRYVAKPLAAAAFVAVPLLGGVHDRYGALIVVGLVLGLGGDVGLMLPGKRAFVAGTALFLLGHLAYVAAAFGLGEPGWLLGPHTLAPLALIAVVLRWLWPYLGRPGAPAPRPLVIAYVLVIATMLLAALSPVAAGETSRRAVLLAIGGVVFCASDLAVARQRFVYASFWNKAWGLPAYFAAQVMIGWSAIS